MLKCQLSYGGNIGGFGDLFRTLPYFETLNLKKFYISKNFAKNGALELFQTLFPDCLFIVGDDYTYHNITYDTATFTPRSVRPNRLKLSDKTISRIIPYNFPEKYIVIHPVSNGIERRYRHFGSVDLTGINYFIVGYPDETGGIKGTVFPGNFLEVAQLLRGSQGLFCVDSCVMHLANLLNVPSVTIYHDQLCYEMANNNGVGLVNPEPEILKDYVHRLQKGCYKDYAKNIWEKNFLVKKMILKKQLSGGYTKRTRFPKYYRSHHQFLL